MVLGNVLVTSGNVATCVLNAGSFFGEMGLLEDISVRDRATQGHRHSKTALRTKTVTAVVNCELVFLPHLSARKLVDELPAFRARLMQFKASRAQRDALQKIDLARTMLRAESWSGKSVDGQPWTGRLIDVDVVVLQARGCVFMPH